MASSLKRAQELSTSKTTMHYGNYSKRMKSQSGNSGIRNLLTLLLASLLLQSCSVTNYIPEKESLYNEVKVNIEPQGTVPRQRTVKTRLEGLVPDPDKSLWG